MALKLDVSAIKKGVATNLWLDHPFLANMMMRLGVQYEEDCKEPHWAWNDGLTTHINLKALSENKLLQDTLELDNIIFLVGHEILHTMNCTLKRRCGRNPRLWNFATDYEINDLLITNHTRDGITGIGKMPWHPSLKNNKNPNGYIGLYNPKYHGWSAEKIYDDLLEQSKNQDPNGDGQQQKETLDLGGMGSGQGQGNSQDQDQGQGQGQNNQQTAPDGSGQRLLDDHNEKCRPLTQAEENKLKAEIQQTIKAMEQSGQKNCGKGSSDIYDRMAEWLFKEPPFDWKGCLTHYLKAWIKDDYTWKRPGRRSEGAKAYLPSHLDIATINVGIAIDTSGSVGDDELQDFMSHINSILKCFKKFDLDVWCFSGMVHEDTLQHYNQSNHDIRVQKINTTGTTDIESNFRFLEDRKEKYDVFIILTDGIDSIENLQFNKCPVIWGIIGNENFQAPEGVKKSVVVPIEFDLD